MFNSPFIRTLPYSFSLELHFSNIKALNQPIAMADQITEMDVLV